MHLSTILEERRGGVHLIGLSGRKGRESCEKGG